MDEDEPGREGRKRFARELGKDKCFIVRTSDSVIDRMDDLGLSGRARAREDRERRRKLKRALAGNDEEDEDEVGLSLSPTLSVSVSI